MAGANARKVDVSGQARQLGPPMAPLYDHIWATFDYSIAKGTSRLNILCIIIEAAVDRAHTTSGYGVVSIPIIMHFT